MKLLNDFSGGMLREFVNEDLSKDKKIYFEYSEYARKLNSKEIDLEADVFFIDCLHQPYRTRKEYNHVDAFLISRILSEYAKGNILFAVLRTKNSPYKDNKIDENNNVIKNAVPIHGTFKNYDCQFYGGKGCCDGFLQFSGNVKFISGEEKEEFIEEFDGLLEVGFCDISTVFAHLFFNKGQLARFPYNHDMIGLFIKKDFLTKSRSAMENLYF